MIPEDMVLLGAVLQQKWNMENPEADSSLQGVWR